MFVGDDIGPNPNWESLRGGLTLQKDEFEQRIAQFEKERADFQRHIGQREKQLALEAERQRSAADQRIDELKKEFSKREAARELELKQSQNEIQMMRHRADERLLEANKRYKNLSQERLDFEREREDFEVQKLQYNEENNRRLQTETVKFVDLIIKDLKSRETKFSRISFWWSIAGGASLTIAAIPAAASMISGAFWPAAELSWPSLLLYTTKSALFVGIVAIISRYAFTLSGRYLQESLQVSDTVHGVSFGQLYVQSYGATAGWEQVKEAFSNWHKRPDVVTKKPDEKADEGKEIKVEENLDSILKLLNGVSDSVKNLRTK